MNALRRSAPVLLLALLLGCQQQQRPLSSLERETVSKGVKEQFAQLVSAINRMDNAAWAEHYAKDDFASAIVWTDSYATRTAWVNAVTNYFAMRDRQHIEPQEVRVTALAPDLALMTSEEKSEMGLKTGQSIKSKHVFTMVWKKGPDGWKILHSHESWLDEAPSPAPSSGPTPDPRR
jgi:ketosteroid isomerase-like protein